MPLAQKNSKKTPSYDLPVSYRMGETRDRLRDALNVFSNQGRLETRFGRSRYNSTGLGGAVLSLSFFEHTNGEKFLIAKVGTELKAVASSGAHTTIKSGLSENTRHRGVTWARGSSSRHIISVEADGLFQFDGTEFTQLGQAGPAAPVIGAIVGSLVDATYRVGLTYYSSVTGFESNLGAYSTPITTTADGLSVTSIPTTADNATIDKIRIYLKNTASADLPLFVAEINLGTTSYDITSSPQSELTAPLANAAPLSGGGRFITEFNRQLVYAGNSDYRNDVYFSEVDLPDAFNDGTADGRKVLYATLDGAVTGLATGLYNNSVLDPFLVVFKKQSTHIYSEIGGEGKFVPISAEIGCVSHDTIKVKNGAVYFLSAQGWRVIVNGSLVVNEMGNPATLGDGDIDDIFRTPGYAYEANQTLLANAFSVYYSALDQYITWIAEGAQAEFKKAYVYEYRVGGFKPYQFQSPATAACIGYEATGEVVYMADADGFIYKHSTSEERFDHDKDGEQVAIDAFGLMAWIDGNDMDSSYNFRELILKRLVGAGDLDVRAWVNYDLNESNVIVYQNEITGFTLDVSAVDVDAFGSGERSIITGRADINRCGENIMIGFYQNAIGKNIGLVASQLDFSRNGNRN